MRIQLALKCSDLGHLTSSIEVHKQWVARLEEVRSNREMPLYRMVGGNCLFLAGGGSAVLNLFLCGVLSEQRR